jgi:sigma-E factor negative regulatory protein RseA
MKETLSAWMDSELSEQQAGALLPQLKRDAQLRRDWDCYHLIGDALRGVEGADLGAGIRARLDAEPTVLAPQRRGKPEKRHWAALSVAASAAAVAFVGWMALPGTQQNPVQVAVVPAAEVRQVAVPAGEGAKNYLLAHQRYSPSSAMQGVAPYVRTVAEERSSARR